MSLNWFPYYEDWGKSLAANKLTKDNGIKQALTEFWKFDADQYEKRLGALPKIQRLAGDFKKSKEVVAAGDKAIRMVGDLLDVIPKVKKKLEEDKKEFEAKGAHKIDVQILVMDWNGKNMEYAEAFAEFEAPGVPKVTKQGKLSASGMTISGVLLRPSGSLNLMVVLPSKRTIEGATDYEFKDGKSLIKFKAIQHVKIHKTTAKSLSEATNKTGVEGEVGVEFEVVKVGGKVTSEDEYKKGYEDSVEWEIEEGVATFKDFKQL